MLLLLPLSLLVVLVLFGAGKVVCGWFKGWLLLVLILLLFLF